MFFNSKPEIIFEGDSAYARITIIDDNGTRTMYMGDNQEAETSILIKNPLTPVFEYPGLFFLSLALRPQARNIVMLGLGGGYIPRLCQLYLPDHQLTVVEIDPLVVELASVYFDFNPGANVKVEIADGLDYLTFLRPESVDVIWHDAFDGYYIPQHLATTTFLKLTRRVLKEDGLLTQNLHRTKPAAFMDQLTITAEVFDEPSLLFYGSRSGNAVLISPNGPLDVPRGRAKLTKAAKAFGPKIGPYNLLAEIEKETAFPKVAPCL
ncbi:MAG: fused MFS/spermidine synthase [Deltaproteobacteria bacterium]|jgi:spermidine synthase|nr:fused MFS/spermidine synthase [Deltaproteobacteria bacterium]